MLYFLKVAVISGMFVVKTLVDDSTCQWDWNQSMLYNVILVGAAVCRIKFPLYLCPDMLPGQIFIPIGDICRQNEIKPWRWMFRPMYIEIDFEFVRQCRFHREDRCDHGCIDSGFGRSIKDMGGGGPLGTHLLSCFSQRPCQALYLKAQCLSIFCFLRCTPL